MIRIRTTSLNKSQYFFTALLFAIILNSCASLSSLDKAQDDFNKAAEIENAVLLGQSIYVATPAKSAKIKYTSAYEEVNKALQKDGQLKKLDVYVDALFIKALCEWKLKNLKNEEAIKTANLAKTNMGENAAQDRPRDYAVMSALGTLIEIEEMNVHQDTFFKVSKFSSNDGKMEYDKIGKKIEGYIKNIEDISTKISKTHEVQTYLIICQLSALKVWDNALDSAYENIEENAVNDEWYAKQKKDQRIEFGKYTELLKKRIGEKNGVYLHWKKQFAL